MSRLLKTLHNNKDWVVATVCAIFVALIVHIAVSAGFFGGNDHQYRSFLDEPMQTPRASSVDSLYSSELYDMLPPHPGVPTPSGEQRTFYKYYDEKDVTYHVDINNIVKSNDPLVGLTSFKVYIYNWRNAHITISGEQVKAVTVGCIAKENPYRTVDVVANKQLSFAPYETKEYLIEVEPDCIYIGTADNRYFWNFERY